MSELVQQLRAAGVLSALDQQLAAALPRLAGPEPAPANLQLAIALLSRHVAEGHVCLPLEDLASGALAARLAQAPGLWPDASLDAWVSLLRSSPLVEEGEGCSPLVLDGEGRLYLRRYYAH
ncbi:MAG TPA: hypothetical protein VJR89_31680 [Polyangiales bacterium]|nr:hypothetical protein [Polyangiales bacterium]